MSSPRQKDVFEIKDSFLKLARDFYLKLRNIYDVLSINNDNFHTNVKMISELEIKDATELSKLAFYRNE